MKSPEEMAQVAFSRREAYKKEKEEREYRRETFCRRASAITMAVLCVVVLGVGGVLAATLDLGDLFQSFFSIRQGSSLSKNQTTYIEEHIADIGESVTQDGYTVTLKGALTDGTTAHILVDIIAPEGQNIESIEPGFYLDICNMVQEGQEDAHIYSVSTTFYSIPDNDGKENTRTVLMLYNIYGSNFSLADGRKRDLYLSDIWYVENEYPYTFNIVTEGPWHFEFAFDAVDDREVELLKAPIHSSYTQISGELVNAKITSFLMKGLSATIHYTLTPGAVQEAGDFGAIKFVMKDGSVYNAYPKKAGQTTNNCHYCTYVFEAPISIEDVVSVYIGENEINIS